MSLTPVDVDRLRGATTVVIEQHNNYAAIVCRGRASSTEGLVGRLVGRFRPDEHVVPVQTGYNSRRLLRRGHTLDLVLDQAHLDPHWAAATHFLQPGAVIGLEWARHPATDRPDPRAAQLSVSGPFVTPRSFRVISSRPSHDARRGRPRVRPMSVLLAGAALWAVASSGSVGLALALALLSMFGLVGVRPLMGKLWTLVKAGFLASLWPVLPSLVVLVGCWWAFRSRWLRRRLSHRWRARARRKRTGELVPYPAGREWPTSDAGATDFEATGRRRLRDIAAHFDKHVANVAKMVDHLDGGWPYRVKANDIDPEDPADHLLTVVFGDVDYGTDQLVGLAAAEGHPERGPCIRAALGNEACPHLPRTPDGTHNRALYRCWMDQLGARLGMQPS